MMLTGKHLATWPASPLAIGTVRTFGIGTALYGLLVIVQGPPRWSAASFNGATDLAPSWVWGLVFALLGALILVGSFGGWFAVRNLGMYGAALWFGFFGYTVETVALHNPHVSFTGGVLYLMIATAICWAARAREESRHARLATRL